ncbi:uracil-DNA glycosylase [Hasllibacter halocynthiae]|uniref:Uracil-DNA glycosylase n=1 Tax=Hasllibacter halocynthiae TaxID=595589 RepID=A0A2T0X9V3_9RHOB|nr:uracil-DNA glycosylase family protein [Hasllibacter halocynthiae]PRY95707.1 uracil-DNA glycosylase [Hasllibacter halocynthiae]
MEDLRSVKERLAACRICADRFAATATSHSPRPVVWFDEGASVLVASQAPGMRVHEAMTPFWDRSGQRLRQWMGVTDEEFYDRSRVAIVPMGFCFPGYDAKGGDLPPPPVCWKTWRTVILDRLSTVRLTLLIGGYAQRWHLGAPAKAGVTATVAAWRDHAPAVFPLPHPSWRNTAWLKRNPWFETDLLPVLRRRVREVI